MDGSADAQARGVSVARTAEQLDANDYVLHTRVSSVEVEAAQTPPETVRREPRWCWNIAAIASSLSPLKAERCHRSTFLLRQEAGTTLALNPIFLEMSTTALNIWGEAT
jgi:hypothetical protein